MLPLHSAGPAGFVAGLGRVEFHRHSFRAGDGGSRTRVVCLVESGAARRSSRTPPRTHSPSSTRSSHLPRSTVITRSPRRVGLTLRYAHSPSRSAEAMRVHMRVLWRVLLSFYVPLGTLLTFNAPSRSAIGAKYAVSACKWSYLGESIPPASMFCDSDESLSHDAENGPERSRTDLSGSFSLAAFLGEMS